MAKQQLVRVLLRIPGANKKFFNILPAPDNSFYVHAYRPPGQPWRIPTGVPDTRGTEIDFDDFIEPTLKLHKVTLHQSGYVHANDRSGRRHQDGIRGPSFRQAILPHDICAVVPCDPQLLPAAGREGGSSVTVEFAGTPAPFYSVLSVIAAASPPHLSSACAANLIFEGFEFGISLALKPVIDAATGQPPQWPPFPFFVFNAA